MSIRALVNDKFSVRTDGNSVKISGWANRFDLQDSYGTRFDPETCDLKRFSLNKVILFNHDCETPIGTGDVTLKPEGVWVDATISQSQNGKIPLVRDLIKEQILKALSIRFGGDNIKTENDPKFPGGMLFKNWELQEISVVSIPAQPQSVFNFRSAQNAFRKVSNILQAKEAVMKVRGMKLAKAVSDKVKEIVAAQGLSRDDIMQRLRDESGMEAGTLAKCLEGEVTPAPEGFIDACVKILSCDKEQLKGLNAEDVEAVKEETEGVKEETQKDKPVEPEKRQATQDQPPTEPVEKKEVSNESESAKTNELLTKLVSMMSSVLEIIKPKEMAAPVVEKTKPKTEETESEEQRALKKKADEVFARLEARLQA